MKLSKYEKETIILTNEEDQYYSVYTFNQGLQKRLKNFAERYPECCYLSNSTKEGSERNLDVQPDQVFYISVIACILCFPMRIFSGTTLPFEVMTSKEVREDVRLKYRYLDLRNAKVKDNIVFRSKVISYLRQKMTDM